MNNEADPFVEYVERVCKICFGGRLPMLDDTRFVAAILSATPDLEEQPEAVLACFAAGVTQAIDCLRRQQTARWQN
jgi:hypothetical protein